MGKRRPGKSDSDGIAATAADAPPTYNTVFIDTSLDTHLAMIVSDSDTAADLKKKIILEHLPCFPKLGEIEIHALKVKRKGYFYHLSDSMLVRSAFEGAKKSWFVSVDASFIKEHDGNQHILKPDTDNKLALVCIPNDQLGDRHDIFDKYLSKKFPAMHNSANEFSPGLSCGEVSKDVDMEMNNIEDGDCKHLPSGIDKKSDLESEEKYDDTSKCNKNPDMVAYQKNEKSRKVTGHVLCSNSLEQSIKIEPPAKKKRKASKKNEDHSAAFSATSMGKLCPVMENSLVNGDKEVSDGDKYMNEKLCEILSLDNSKLSETILPETCAHHRECEKEMRQNTFAVANNIMPPKEDEHLTTNSGRKKIKKRKVKDNSSVPQGEVAPVMPSVMQDEPLDEAPKVPLIDEHGDPIPELPRNGLSSFSIGTVFEPDAGNTYGKSNAAKQAAEEEDGHLTTCSSRKKKKKKKAKDDSSVVQNEVDTMESYMIQDEPLDEASKISLINKPGDPVLEVLRNGVSSTAIGWNPDVAGSSSYDNSEVHKQAADINRKGTTYLRKHHSTIVKQIYEPHNLREDVHSAQKNAVPDDQTIEAEQRDEVEEKSDLSAYHDPEVMLREGIKPPSDVVAGANFKEPIRSKTSEKIETEKSHGTYSKRRTKSTVRNQAVSNMEHPIVAKKGNANSVSNDVFEAKMDRSIFSESESDKPDKIQEEMESSVNPDSAIMTFQKSNLTIQVEEDIITKESDLTPKSSDLKEVMKCTETASGKRKKRQAKKPAATNQDASAMDHSGINVGVTSSTVPDSALINHSINEIEKDDSILEHTEDEGQVRCKSAITTVRTNKPEHLTQMNQAQEIGKDANEELGKNDKRNHSNGNHPDLSIDKQINEVECLEPEKISNIQEDADVSNKKQKKRKNKSNLGAKTQSDLPIKEQELGCEKGTAFCDEGGKMNSVSKDAKKPGISETEPKVGLGKVAGTGPSSSNADQISDAEGTFKAKVDDDNYVEVSKSEGIDFKHYFVPGEHGSEVAQADKLKEVNDIKSKNHAEKHVVPSVGASPEFQNPVTSHKNQSNEREFRIGKPNSDNFQQLSTDKYNESVSPRNKKSSKDSGDAVKALSRQRKISQETGQRDLVTGPGTTRPAPALPNEKSISFDASGSSSDHSSQNVNVQRLQSNSDHREFRKPSNVNPKLVMNNSEGGKTLFTAPRPNVKKGNVESSADETGTANSDASTRTPSDSSSSSELSGESDLSLDSSWNGTYGAKRKEDSGKNKRSHSPASAKNMTMDMIFRSSSRFKKAKLTAAQLQGGNTESQDVEFVPDSLPCV